MQNQRDEAFSQLTKEKASLEKELKTAQGDYCS